VTELVTWLEGSALATFTRESPSIWAYPTILTLHTIGLSILVGANAVVNFRLLGFGRRVPLPSLRPLFAVTWWAFALNAATGFALFASDATHRSGQRVFHIKLALIAFAILGTVAAKRVVFQDADWHETEIPTRGRTLAMLSLLLWTGAIVAGRLMAYL
jgi:hypothetical protein